MATESKCCDVCSVCNLPSIWKAKCSICENRICKECSIQHHLFVETMLSPSKLTRTYRCRFHIHAPVRMYDTLEVRKDKDDSEADVG